MMDLSELLGGIRCWWSDIPWRWCGHCLRQCNTRGEFIE